MYNHKLYPVYTVDKRCGVLIKNILDIEPGTIIKMKKDRRFKKDHIKVQNNEIRGDVNYVERLILK